ncbi:glutamate racemase [Helicobacter sp. 13S00401-1]|uniref:glutamate racemase n=1 Tax=Helicobacter sp. 13S00401-1 TaxID=1905758 RepID=UPI000BA54829|nr:glutamate racemase [Helicobacter sp. 13S00401-1]PAF51745.1 glutamate racemase [Helicobacter sp. 13S00401-1]
MKNSTPIKKVAIFDSGIGGLSVVKSLIDANMFEHIIYYGDTARVPYGSKDKTTIISFSLEALSFLEGFEPELIIVACNTVSACAIPFMQENTKIPIIGVIQSGMKAIVSKNLPKTSNILVIGTQTTISSNIYQDGLKDLGFINVQALETGLFVPLVEAGIYEGELVKASFNHYFKDVKNVDALVLGCTHFPLLIPSLKEYFGSKCVLIHSGETMASYLNEHYNIASCPRDKIKINYHASSNVYKLQENATKWLNL